MSILDDENILIEKTKDSVNLPKVLDGMYKLYRQYNKIDFAEMREFIDKLPVFDGTEWYVTSLTSISLCYKHDILSSYCSLKFFNKFVDDRVLPHVFIEFPSTYPDLRLQEIQNNIKMLFNLHNNPLWDYRKYIYSEQFIYNVV